MVFRKKKKMILKKLELKRRREMKYGNGFYLQVYTCMDVYGYLLIVGPYLQSSKTFFFKG